MSSWDKFEETKLSPKEAFHSNLNISEISKYDYEHAQKVWKEFKMKNLGEYHDLSLMTDVLLLSNMFQAFKNTCLEYYKLDPAHFYTSSGLTWQACLNKTGVRLKLLTDPDMLLMFEKGIRGCITQEFIDTRKPTTSTWVSPKERAASYSIWTQTICMVGLRFKSSKLEDLSGSVT